MMRVGGVVLCGGMSQRMGQPKAWLPFGNELMLPRVVRIVSSVVRPVVVVAAPDQELPPLPENLEIVRDEARGRGPLQGLSAGIKALRDRVDAVFASSCDVPFLNPVFITRMIELLGEANISVAHVDGFFHPLGAVYRVAVLERIDALLAQDRLRPMDLFDTEKTRIVTATELPEGLESLVNLNTAEDYQQALKMLDAAKGRGSSPAGSF